MMVFVERCMDLLRALVFPFSVAYWLYVPMYDVCCIVFDRSSNPDPLGLYRNLTEWGIAKYD